MRIAIDVSGAIGAPSGMLRYTRELLQALAEVDQRNEYLIYAAFWKDFPDKLLRLPVPQARNFKALPIRLPQRLLLRAEENFHWNLQERILLRHGAQLVHGAANILPILKSIPSLVTLHHVGTPPKTAGAWDQFYFGELTPRSVRCATRLIAVSEFTRQEAIKHLGVLPEKIVTVWEGGASSAFFSAPDPAAQAGLGLRPPYILFVSAINPRKNLLRLARAFKLLKEKGFPHQLVFVGTCDAAYTSLHEEISSLGLASEVLFLDRLSEEQLNAVYRGAELFVYPSLLEGFGLPVLEAMACGVPVVTTTSTCLPEIAGDAALFAEALDEKDLARQMERGLTDKDLRLELADKGLKRARSFSWAETARRTLAVYEEIV